MCENAILLSVPGEERSTVINWLTTHEIEFDKESTTEELIQLYRDVECGRYANV